MSSAGFIALYTFDFEPLGKWTQHVSSEWSLNRKAYEFDEFTATCKGFENSRRGCFVGLHSPTGEMEYVAFCGIPLTVNHLTTIKALDCRRIYDQELVLDFTQTEEDGTYSINSVESLYRYLLKECLADLPIGITWLIDVRDVKTIDSDEDFTFTLDREIAVYNLWDFIQKKNNLYDVVVLAESEVDVLSNTYRLVFRAKRINQKISIRLSDYEVTMSSSSNVTNRVGLYVTMTDEDGYSWNEWVTYYLYNDNTIGTEYDSDKVTWPPVTECPVEFEDGATEPTAITEDEALEQAQEILYPNRYKDKVTIDLNTKLGFTLQNIDLTYMVEVNEYNPADVDTAKTLPVFGIKTDSKGNKSITLGRLSDYWFND